MAEAAVGGAALAAAKASGWWVNELSPWAIHLGGNWGIRWYGLAYLAGILGGMWLLNRWSARGRVPLRKDEIQDFALYVGLGMIIGGRLGYCLLYGWDQLVANPFGRFVESAVLTANGVVIERTFELPYLIRLWEGGMASHGGTLGFVGGIWLFARKHRRDLLVLCDTVAAAVPLGILFGRLANFVNGELWGRPWNGSWAVIFPAAPLIDGRMVPRHPSQLYEAALEGALLLACVLPFHARHRRPGLTSGAVLASYAVVRIICEIFREPDVGQPVFFGLISKGQAFSLPMLAIGLGLVWWALRRPPAPERYLAPPAPAAPAPAPATPA
jgi:phosphatidylglycerol:prolipoprotein diacylglycerol transferase